MAQGRGPGVNYVAWLAVLAATSFALPLLVQAGEAVGLGRGTSVTVSLMLAAGAVAAWLVRSWLLSPRPRRRHHGAARSAPARRRTSPRGGGAGSLVDGGTLRLVDAEEESRAGV
ncbi:MAG: hypothetical protein P8Y13_14905 [Deinococcales bacterium]